VQWFLNLPDWLYGILSIPFAVLIGVGGLLVTRKWISRLHVTASHNEIVSYYLSTVAIFYGIMLGLIAVSVWESHDAAGTAIAAEVGSLATLYRDVSGYPEPERSTFQADLREYTRYEIDVGWAEHRKGIISGSGIKRLWLFQSKLQTFEPRTIANIRAQDQGAGDASCCHPACLRRPRPATQSNAGHCHIAHGSASVGFCHPWCGA